MYQVSADDAKARLSDLIRAAVQGETVLISDDENEVVQLVPVARPKGKRKAGSAKGKIVMRDDFDAPLPDFAEYMA